MSIKIKQKYLKFTIVFLSQSIKYSFPDVQIKNPLKQININKKTQHILKDYSDCPQNCLKGGHNVSMLKSF